MTTPHAIKMLQNMERKIDHLKTMIEEQERNGLKELTKEDEIYLKTSKENLDNIYFNTLAG